MLVKWVPSHQPWFLQLKGRGGLYLCWQDGSLKGNHNQEILLKYQYTFLKSYWKSVIIIYLYWFHIVHPSVLLSVDRIVSALYLQQYSLNPFYIDTSYQATSEDVSRVEFVAKLQNLNFWQIFKIWLAIQYESIVWVIMGWQGVFSEWRHSSCSSWFR